MWDSEHRLVELVKPSGGSVRYRYDAAGMRVQATRSSDGRVTTWGYDGASVAAVWRHQAGGTPTLVSTFVTAPSGDPLQATSDGETVYGVLDGLGSVTGTLDAASGLASSVYSVFGQPAGAGPVGLGDVYGYTGHAWDADAGMHYARARWYDAGTGRFASEDPVDAMNLYSYVGNQPLTYVDPAGMMAVDYAVLTQIASAAAIALLAGVAEIEEWALNNKLPASAAGICAGNMGIMMFLAAWGALDMYALLLAASPVAIIIWALTVAAVGVTVALTIDRTTSEACGW